MFRRATLPFALPLTLLCALPLFAPGCTADSIGGGGNGGSDLDPLNPPDPPFPDDPFPEGTCGDVNVVVNGVTPTVQLLIDQSGSMAEDFGNMNRWEAVYTTLMGPDGVVPRLESAVRFGLSLYTSFEGNEGGTCPVLTEVMPSLDNFAAMDARFAPAEPEVDTPTGESLVATAATLRALDVPGPKIIVLGTDGEPDTCAVPNPSNGQPEAIAAAQGAFADGIRTYVISVGDDVGESHLQDMANAGVGLPINGTENATYYRALSAEDLINAFGAIVGGVTGCVFTINGEVDPAKAAQGLVALDGRALNHGSEWRMLDGKTFEVLGGACDTIQDGDLHHVSAAFPCGSVVVD
jgi:hypothetical protein